MQVTVIDTKYGTHTYDLNAMGKNAISFGRKADCDIVMQSSFVSRPHGVIFMENGSWYVQDTNSTYGMYWMDRKVDKVPVTDGTVIRIYSEGNINGRYVELRFSEPYVAPAYVPPVEPPVEPPVDPPVIEPEHTGSGKTVAIILSVVVAALAIGLVLFFVLRTGTTAKTKEDALKNFASAMSKKDAGKLLDTMFPESIRSQYEKKMKANGYSDLEAVVNTLLLVGLGDSYECEFVSMSETKVYNWEEIQTFETDTLGVNPADVKIQDMVAVKANFRMKGQIGSKFTEDWITNDMTAYLYMVDDAWYVFPNN